MGNLVEGEVKGIVIFKGIIIFYIYGSMVDLLFIVILFVDMVFFGEIIEYVSEVDVERVM